MLSCDKVLELGDSSLWKRFLFISAYFMIMFNYVSIVLLFLNCSMQPKLMDTNCCLVIVLEDRDLTLRERFLLF